MDMDHPLWAGHCSREKAAHAGQGHVALLLPFSCPSPALPCLKQAANPPAHTVLSSAQLEPTRDSNTPWHHGAHLLQNTFTPS